MFLTFIRLSVCSSLLVATASLPYASRPGTPQVMTQSGLVEGTFDGSSVNAAVFLGIPFAAPPIGDRRWRPPLPVQPWSGVRAAKQFASACSQLPSPWWPEMAGRERLDTSEDCLYLNVWTPNLNHAGKIPVMVWIHGGGNVEGSSQIPPLAPALSRKGVVVVSVDYRLGILGFLAHPALSAESPQHTSGNYGLLDQIAALAWIQQNIAAFGGDPRRVTVFGESSGAEDVCHLLASPRANGMFQGAILQSGVCMDSLYSHFHQPQNYYHSHGPGERLGLRMAAAFGISDGSHALASLRALPVEDLLKGARDTESADFGVVVDGWSVPLQPALTFANGGQAPVPLLVGSNSDETTVFGKASPLAAEDSRPKTIAQYRAWLAHEFREFAEDVWKVYPAGTDEQVHRVFIRMQTDYEFGFGAHRLAAATAARGQPAYLYYFTYVGRGQFAALGAFHSEELMFLGDTYWRSWIRNAPDEHLADIMSDYWTQFAKTGSPNRGDQSKWPPYLSGSELCMELGRVVKARATPNRAGYEVFDHILKARLGEIASLEEK
jgi:para-nitrobenzyl esterase